MSVTERQLTVDGRRVGIAEYGDPAGRPVLALHGAPACRLMFAAADGEACARALRIIAPDRPGYGLSDSDTQASLADRANALVRLADTLGLERFAILAVSGGAPYAVALAQRLGRRCSVLAVVSPMGPIAEVLAKSRAEPVRSQPNRSLPHPATPPHHDEPRQAPWDDDMLGRATAGAGAGSGNIATPPGDAIPRAFRRFFIDLQRWPRLLGAGSRLAATAFRLAPHTVVRAAASALSPADRAILARPAARRLIVAMTREALRQGVGGGLADLAVYARPWGVDYARIAAPVRIWQGTADRIVAEAAALYLAAAIADARLHRIEAGGHFWVLDHVGEVLDELAAAWR